ncbi:MAG: hypothetical protein R3350_08260, partial [Saprospiraceae bacterium]|nr:hypothetical protein [Saprospiraceae bacterium]
MKDRYSFASLTRISDLKNKPFTVEALPKDDWSLGDYVLGNVTQPYPKLRLELPDGRMMELVRGDLVVGALGVRHATLEATGTWKRIGSDGLMHLLTGAGLLGKMTSKSVFLAKLVELKYQGHLLLEGQKTNMKDFVPPVPDTTFDIPVILVVGTSMSAGKTTAACILIRQLKRLGLSVVGAKVTGAGRYQDILAMRDSGADQVFDFVDAGLGTSICSQEEFLRSLKVLLNLIGGAGAEVAVIEIGASPLEP